MKSYFSLTPLKGQIIYLLERKNTLGQVADRIKWHLFPQLYIVPKFPTHIDIETSSKCQLNCPMCGQRLMEPHMRGVMDFELYKKIIDEATPYVYSIKLSWRGEPLLNPHIWEMVRYAKEKGIKDVAFLTNGEALKEDKIEEMINSGLDWISFSIDGLDGTYEKIRYPAKFKEIVSKLKKIKEIKEQKNSKKPLVRVQSIFSAIKDNPNKYVNFWSPIADRINIGSDEKRADKDKVFPRDPNYVCHEPWRRLIVAWDGVVVSCPTDYLLKYPLGNAKEKRLIEIWKDQPIQHMRHMQKTKQRLQIVACADCCHGGLMNERWLTINKKKIKIKEYIGQKEESYEQK